MKFYFAYGTDPGFPFQGGWTEVKAANYSLAIIGFTTFHPNRKNSKFLNCGGMYDEVSWANTKMAKDNDHFGHARREKITVSATNAFEAAVGRQEALVKTISIVREVLDDG